MCCLKLYLVVQHIALKGSLYRKVTEEVEVEGKGKRKRTRWMEPEFLSMPFPAFRIDVEPTPEQIEAQKSVGRVLDHHQDREMWYKKASKQRSKWKRYEEKGEIEKALKYRMKYEESMWSAPKRSSREEEICRPRSVETCGRSSGLESVEEVVSLVSSLHELWERFMRRSYPDPEKLMNTIRTAEDVYGQVRLLDWCWCLGGINGVLFIL